MYLLSKAGRKTILMSTCAILGVMNLLIGYFYTVDDRTIVIVSCLCMITLFEFGSGPITWLYMAEIMQDKGSSLATVMNWLVNLAISYYISILTLHYPGNSTIGIIFYIMGAATILSVFFMMFFMKETRGKSPKEIEEMFYSSSIKKK
jgi:MFS family permease